MMMSMQHHNEVAPFFFPKCMDDDDDQDTTTTTTSSSDCRPPELPAHYEYLASGLFGTVYLSRSGTTALKVFKEPILRESVIQREYENLVALERLAPEYLPVPCKLELLGSGGIPAIQMTNAGITFDDFLSKQKLSLTGFEYALCILQSIHFVLLINDEFNVNDVHSGNLCFRMRGEHICLKFIDVGMWDYNTTIPGYPLFLSQARRIKFGIVHNADQLFWDKGEGTWQTILQESISNNKSINTSSHHYPPPENDNALTIALLEILQKSTVYSNNTTAAHMRNKDGEALVLNHKNVYGKLISLAEDVKLCAYGFYASYYQYYQLVSGHDAVHHHDEKSEIDFFGDIMAKIDLAYRMALLRVPPQPHDYCFDHNNNKDPQ